MRVGIEKLDLVDSILRHNSIYPYVIDDYSADQAVFTFEEILSSPACYALMPNEGSLFVFIPQNGILYEVHCAVLPEWRGMQAVGAAKAAKDWMYANTPCQKIFTVCPAYNAAAYALARRSGMTRVGVITNSFLKGGKLIDLILLSCGKGE